MDDKKRRGEEIEVNYYNEWSKGAERIKQLLELEDEAVIIGEKEGPIKVTERRIEVIRNVALHEIPDILNRFKEALNELVSKWMQLVEKIESNRDKLDFQENHKIQKLLKNKKKTIELAKKILDWIEENLAQEKGIRALRKLEDPPFKDLKKLAKKLNSGGFREKIVVKIKMEI